MPWLSFFGVPVKCETKNETKPTKTKQNDMIPEVKSKAKRKETKPERNETKPTEKNEIEIDQCEIKVNWYISNYSSVRNNMVKLQMVPGSSRSTKLSHVLLLNKT